MGQNTAIEWCDSTCNLMIGCDGCELTPEHCYAERLVNRYAGKNRGFPLAFDKPELFLDRLDEALRWKDLTGTERPAKPWLNGRPRMIFVNDLGDCFTESMKQLGWLSLAVDRIAKSPHNWLLLTKRPRRLAEFVETWERERVQKFPENVWGGTTVTGPETIGRVAELLKARLFVRFLSCEPLLGPISVRFYADHCSHCGKKTTAGTHVSGIRQNRSEPFSWYCGRSTCFDQLPLPAIDWVIAGGETGPGARPAHPEWFRSLRDQCQAAGVPFFFKGWGNSESFSVGGSTIRRYSKIKDGRLLDGFEWNELPEVDA